MIEHAVVFATLKTTECDVVRAGGSYSSRLCLALSHMLIKRPRTVQNHAKTFSLSVVAIVLSATVTVSGSSEMRRRCLVLMYITSDLSGFSSNRF